MKIRRGKGGRGTSSVHQSVGEADFGAVYGTISGGFEDGEIICVFGVEEEGVDGILCVDVGELSIGVEIECVGGIQCGPLCLASLGGRDKDKEGVF